MNPIAATEDAIIAAANAPALKEYMRPMKTLPGAMSLAVLKKISANTPSTHVAFLGGSPVSDTDSGVFIDAVFGVYIVTDQASGNTARRRGDSPRSMGAYDVAALILPLINGLTVTGVGTLKFKRLENLFDVEIDKQGVSIYAATFGIRLALEYSLDEATLNNFITYDATHVISEDPQVPVSEDNVQLEQ